MTITTKTCTTATIIAIGGGGFTHDSDPELEQFILAQCPTSRPAIGYLGIANHNDDARIQRFYQCFASKQHSLSHLPDLASPQAAQWFAQQDIFYVGGGNSAFLINQLRAAKLDTALAEAGRRGALLCGVSAGAVCWFDAALSDSLGSGLAPLLGLGVVAGSCCPHYSSEAQRRPAYESHIAYGLLPDGIAIDDGVAVLLEHEQPARAYTARHNNLGAYHVTRVGDTAVTSRCPML